METECDYFPKSLLSVTTSNKGGEKNNNPLTGSFCIRSATEVKPYRENRTNFPETKITF